MKLLILSIILFTSIQVNAAGTMLCEPQSPCKYASSVDLDQCLKTVFRVRIFGRSLQGHINSPLLSEKTKIYSASVKVDENRMDILSIDGNISLDTYYMSPGRYDGTLDVHGYIFNVICEEI